MNELAGYDIEDLEVGQTATFAKTITEADIVLFAGASGDNNAVHINEEFAQTTQFKGRIAHGMLTASVISAAIAGRLPGPAPFTWARTCASRPRCVQAKPCMPR
jgi:3-hydroxybutyryl-CoA dehydratase